MSDVTKKRVGPIVTLLSRVHPVSHQTIHLKSNCLHRCVKFSGTVFWAWTITRPSVWWPSTHQTSPVILPARNLPDNKASPKTEADLSALLDLTAGCRHFSSSNSAPCWQQPLRPRWFSPGNFFFSYACWVIQFQASAKNNFKFKYSKIFKHTEIDCEIKH